VNNIWDGLWYLVALGTLWYGWSSGKRSYWLLAGFALGFAQYFYATARVLFVIVPLWLLLATLFDRQGWKRNKANALPALVVLFAVLMPLAWYIKVDFAHYFGEIKTNSILGPWMEIAVREQHLPAWRILLKQFGLGFGGFFSVNLSFWYRPGVPILRPLPAVLFIFALAMFSLRLRDLRIWIFLLWLAAYGTIASLSESSPAAQRLAGVGPACAMLVGFAAVEIFSLLSRFWPSRKQLLGLAAVLLVGYLALDDLRFYFREFTPNSVYMGKYDFSGYGGEVAADIVRRLKDEPGDWQVLFLNNGTMGFYSNPSLRYQLPKVTGLDINSTWGSPDNPVPDRENLLFVFFPGREEEIPLIQADYPGGTLGVVTAPNGSVLYTYYSYRSKP
jgi:hypothetical protein